MKLLDNISSRNKKLIFAVYLSSNQFGKIPINSYQGILSKNKDNDEQSYVLKELKSFFTEQKNERENVPNLDKPIKKKTLQYLMILFLTINGCKIDTYPQDDLGDSREEYFMPPLEPQTKEIIQTYFTEKYPELTKSLTNQFLEKYKSQNNIRKDGSRNQELHEAEIKFKGFLNEYGSDLDTVILLNEPLIKYYDNNDSSKHNAYYNGSVNIFGEDTLDNFVAEIAHHLMNDHGPKRQLAKKG